MIIEYKNDTAARAAARTARRATASKWDFVDAPTPVVTPVVAPVATRVARSTRITPPAAPKFKKARREWRPEFNDAVRAKCRCRCTSCGTPAVVGDRLTIHHIQSWEFHPELRFTLSNATLLCGRCHRDLHAREDRAEGLRKYNMYR